MEKICEFCTALRPVVYCKADAAHLCLSCDARVHSANALSGRHFRTLLCQSCRNRTAYVRCANHEMFICRNCDRTLHGFSSQHQKRLLKTYMGCPSPKDFAVLWGFDVNVLDNCGNGDRFVSSSTGSAGRGGLNLKSQNQYPNINGPSACSSTSAKASSGSSRPQRKMNQQRDPHEDNNDILQQIIGLKRLQLTEQTHNPSLLRGKEQAEFLSTVFENSQKLEENLDQGSRQFPDISNDLQTMDISRQGLNEEPCSSPFSQLEHLASPATVGTLTNGNAVWQWKSPVFDSQLWSQNMQDLGFCEEFECFDDIPDIDPTFRNVEDLFGADQDTTLPFIDNEDMYSSFKSTSLDISEDEHARSFEGASASSSDTYTKPPHRNNTTSPLGQEQATVEIPNFFNRQLSLSKLGTESSFSYIKGDIHEDEGVSLILTARGEASSDGTQLCSPRYKDKKKTTMREKGKQTRYSPQAADLKRRAKNHFSKPDSHQTKSISSSQSY